jgi:hypothetical protein
LRAKPTAPIVETSQSALTANIQGLRANPIRPASPAPIAPPTAMNPMDAFKPKPLTIGTGIDSSAFTMGLQRSRDGFEARQKATLLTGSAMTAPFKRAQQSY